MISSILLGFSDEMEKIAISAKGVSGLVAKLSAKPLKSAEEVMQLRRAKAVEAQVRGHEVRRATAAAQKENAWLGMKKHLTPSSGTEKINQNIAKLDQEHAALQRQGAMRPAEGNTRMREIQGQRQQFLNKKVEMINARHTAANPARSAAPVAVRPAGTLQAPTAQVTGGGAPAATAPHIQPAGKPTTAPTSASQKAPGVAGQPPQIQSQPGVLASAWNYAKQHKVRTGLGLGVAAGAGGVAMVANGAQNRQQRDLNSWRQPQTYA